MVTVVTPNPSLKPGLVELRVDDVHMATVFGTVSEITLDQAVHQFMVVVETEHLVAYLWADKVQGWADSVPGSSLLRVIDDLQPEG